MTANQRTEKVMFSRVLVSSQGGGSAFAGRWVVCMEGVCVEGAEPPSQICSSGGRYAPYRNAFCIYQ